MFHTQAFGSHDNTTGQDWVVPNGWQSNEKTVANYIEQHWLGMTKSYPTPPRRIREFVKILTIEALCHAQNHWKVIPQVPTGKRVARPSTRFEPQ